MRTFACCLICLPLAGLHVNSSFGYRFHPITANYAFHTGVDLRARADTVYVLSDGMVTTVAYDAITGIHIVAEHTGFSSLYGHLSQVFIRPGDTVIAGQAIGITGRTGRTSGEHLHFAIRAGGRWVDPLKFIYQLINTKSHE